MLDVCVSDKCKWVRHLRFQFSGPLIFKSKCLLKMLYTMLTGNAESRR